MMPSTRLVLLALVLALGTSTASGQSDHSDRDTPPATASVSGRITSAGEPVSGVSVVAYLQGENGYSLKVLGKSTTDAEGRFRVASLPAGQILVSPRSPAFVAPREGNGPYSGRVVTLSDGENIENIDMNLVAGGVVTGRIVDQDNRPVIGLQVRAMPPRDEAYDWLSIERTDDRGIFRIYGLQAGKYRVRAGDEFGGQMGGSVRSYPKTYFPGTTDEQQAAFVDVTPGSEAKNVDFVVRRTASGFAAIGRVVNIATGKPTPNVFVLCMPVEPSDSDSFSYSPIATDARGEFRVAGLKPGRYKLNVFTSLGRLSSTYADALPFEVVATDVVGLELKLKAGSRIMGSVVFEGRSPSDSAPDYSTIRVYCFAQQTPTDHDDFVPSTPAQVGTDGTFSIEGIRPGFVQIGLDVWNGPKGLTMLRVERDGVVVDGGLELRDGEEVTGLRLVATVGTASIRGRIVPKGGELPAGASFVATATRSAETRSMGQRPAVVDGRNQFLIDGLVEGEYEVAVYSTYRGGGTDAKPLFAKKRVTVSGNQPVDVTIELDVTKPQTEDPE